MRFLCSTTGCLSLVIFCILATETFTSVRGNSQEDDFSEFDDLEHPNAVQFESNDIHPDIPASQSDRSIKEDDEFLDTDDNTSGHLFEGRQGDNVSPDTAAEEDDDGVQIEDGFEETDDDKLSPKKDSKATNESKPKTLKITNIPFHLRNNWQSYYIEICLLILLCGYFVNYVVGMSTNRSIADQFLKGNESLLNALFTLVGDTGVMKSGQYIKESEHWYTLWCTGRNGLECAIFELRLIKRQDLISRMMLLFKPQKDELVVKLFLNEEMMDTYVFCLANRGNGLKQMRELNDVQTYCTQRKDRMGLTGDKLLVLSELGDVAAQLFDQQTLYFLNFLNENEDLINYIHISDQFSGPKVVE